MFPISLLLIFQVILQFLTDVLYLGAEVLHQDSEVLRIKEGATQNLALLNLHNVISDLSSKRVGIFSLCSNKLGRIFYL
jgi:hypothetical protein